MNKLMNDLRLDAGIGRLHDAPYLVSINKSGEIIDPMIGLKKFAELVIRECCKEIEEAPFNAGAESAWLKKHFGVE